jgi:hypothetical protein
VLLKRLGGGATVGVLTAMLLLPLLGVWDRANRPEFTPPWSAAMVGVRGTLTGLASHPMGGTGGKVRTVPTVLGIGQRTASALLRKSGFRVRVEWVRSTVSKGTVVEQSPCCIQFAGEVVTLRASSGYTIAIRPVPLSSEAGQ